jgi:uncharacterized repeat protein (TIGR01451 family)
VTTTVKGSLRIRKTVNKKRVHAGRLVGYVITVTNPTSVAVRNARVCDRLPSGLTIVGTTPKAVRSNGRYCWSLGTVAAKATKHIRISTRALMGTSGTRTNVAALTGSGVSAVTDDARIQVLAASARGGGVTG